MSSPKTMIPMQSSLTDPIIPITYSSSKSRVSKTAYPSNKHLLQRKPNLLQNVVSNINDSAKRAPKKKKTITLPATEKRSITYVGM